MEELLAYRCGDMLRYCGDGVDEGFSDDGYWQPFHNLKPEHFVSRGVLGRMMDSQRSCINLLEDITQLTTTTTGMLDFAQTYLQEVRNPNYTAAASGTEPIELYLDTAWCVETLRRFAWEPILAALRAAAIKELGDTILCNHGGHLPPAENFADIAVHVDIPDDAKEDVARHIAATCNSPQWVDGALESIAELERILAS